MAGMKIFSDGMESVGHGCGGTLINDQYILTAAHCIFKGDQMDKLFEPKEVSWVLGEVDTMLEDEKSKIPKILVKTEKIIPSPDWDKWTTKGDIALVKLAQKVDLKTYTPACLAKTGDNFDGKKACRGDSGGRLTTVVNGQHVLIADVSNGSVC